MEQTHQSIIQKKQTVIQQEGLQKQVKNTSTPPDSEKKLERVSSVKPPTGTDKSEGHDVGGESGD